MGKITKLLDQVYDTLLACYGPQYWWPGETPFEVMVGAVLAQATSWSNAEKAISNLKRAGTLSPKAIRDQPIERLALLVRPSGFFNAKAEKLKALAWWIGEKGDHTDAVLRAPTLQLRNELLGIRGIGPETADSILLYAARKPVFVVDAYTCRFAFRLGIAEEKSNYGELQRVFAENLPSSAVLFNEYHALLVQLGKNRCRKVSQCDRCCLVELCQNKPKD